MGGPGSGRWRRWQQLGGSFTTARQADALRLDCHEVLGARREGWATSLGAIRWLPGTLSTGTRRMRGIPVYRGVLEVDETLLTPRREYVLLLAEVSQPFGGKRYWLQCPTCAKLRRSLFLWQGVKLRCRLCERLAYPMERLTPRKWAALRRDKAARAINPYWDTGCYPPERIKGRHRKRYTQLLEAWHTENRRATERVAKSAFRFARYGNLITAVDMPWVRGPRR